MYQSCFFPNVQRALCAVACLMTSDLLSLEQMFGATQRKLRQLSEGAPGPVANKATKVKRKTDRKRKLHVARLINKTREYLSFFSPAPYLLPTDLATVWGSDGWTFEPSQAGDCKQ